MSSSIDSAALLACLGNWSRGPAALYANLAGALRRAIERGDLPPGTRLPPERSLAPALAVSRGTVMAAYEQLRLAGLLDSRQGSGTWVRTDAARPVAVLNDAPAPGARARRLAARLFDVAPGTVDLSIAAAGIDFPPEYLQAPSLPMLEHLTDRHGYQPLGLPALRNRVADRFCRDGLPTLVEQVAITTGAQQAFSLAIQLLVRPGDAVVVESPTYPGAVDALTRAGARVVSVPAEATWPGVSVLREAVTRNAARLVYLMPACHNPLGHVMTETRRRELAGLAADHEVYLLEDNNLGDTVFDGRRLPPIAAFDRTGRVLTTGSLSKVAWGGLRVGWLRGPAELVDRFGRLKAAHDFGGSALPQMVACRVFEDLDRLAAARAVTMQRRLHLLQSELRRLLPDWRWVEPAGGLSLWVQLPYGDADELVQVALRHRVDVMPGSAHTMDGSHTDWLRIAYARSPEVLCEGVARLAAAWTEYAATLARRTNPRREEPRRAEG